MSSLNIKKLKLWNFRCFEYFEMDFHERLTVIVAPNGAGKTSILDALAISLGPFLGAFDEAVGRHFKASDIRRSRVRNTMSKEIEFAPDGVQLQVFGRIPSESGVFQRSTSKWGRGLAGPKKSKTTIKDAKELIEYGKRLQRNVRTAGNTDVLPLLAYYGTGRLWQQKKLIYSKTIHNSSRTAGYTDCLDPASTYKSLVEWYRYCTFNIIKEVDRFNKEKRQYVPTEFDNYLASIGGAVNSCLNYTDWRDIEYSVAREEMVAHHREYGELPVELLSDGIRNVIGMVADIAFRATKLNPHLGNEASRQTPGIVLIDEVDMHLHPAWQQVVVESLTSAFPHVQFVVTTHSPQVLSSVDFASVRRLCEFVDQEEGRREIKACGVTWQTKGVASSNILAEIMGVDPIPDLPEARWVSDYHALIQQDLYAEHSGMELRDKLDRHFGEQHPVMLDCDRMIRLQKFKQKLPRNLSKSGEHQ